MTIKTKLTRMVWIPVGLLAALAASGQAAQPENAKADPHAVVEKEILNELRQIRALLEKQQQPQPQVAAPAPEKAKVSTVGFEMGRKDAPITIVEFADYQCPYCRQFQTTVFTRLKKDYIDTGKVRFVSRDLPLDFHPNALGAAQAARCAGDQDKYWQMRDLLIDHADKLTADALNAYAGELALDMSRFSTCVGNHTHASKISQDLAEATAAGIAGTPSFVIGKSDGATVNGEKLIGAQPFETFEKILAELSK